MGRAGLPGAVLLALLATTPFIGAAWSITGDRWRDQVAAPLVLLSFGGAFLLAALLARADPWLGAFVALVAGSAMLRPSPAALATLEAVLAGALAVAVARTGGPVWRRLLTAGLVTLGVAQVAYTAGQLVGYDPLWFGLERRSDLAPMGTIRSPGLLGAYLAVVTPLAPLVMIPVLVAGVLMSGSAVAWLGATVGLTLRFRARLRWWVVAVAGVGLAIAMAVGHGRLVESVVWRWSVWTVGLSRLDTGSVLAGRGFGAWAAEMPVRYAAWLGRPGTYGELPTHAHNDLVQLLYDGGLVALGLLVLWLVWHRAAWRGPAGGALAAASVVSLGGFPMHVPTTALLIAAILGLATAPVTPTPA